MENGATGRRLSSLTSTNRSWSRMSCQRKFGAANVYQSFERGVDSLVSVVVSNLVVK